MTWKACNMGLAMRAVARGVLVIIAASLLGCFSRVPNQRFQQRVAEIDALYDQGVDEIERAFERDLEEIDKLKAHLVKIEPSANNEPVEPVAARTDLVRLAEQCDELRRLALATPGDRAEAAFNDCNRSHTELFVSALVAAYWAADLDWISKAFGERPEELDLESLFVYSHNLRLRAYISDRRSAARGQREASLRELEGVRGQAVAVAEEARDREIAENRRAFGAALAAAGQAMSQSQQAPAQPGAYSEVTQPRSCSSDYSCGIGNRCVKNNFSGQGFCAKAVNEYGVRTFDLPRTESVLVKVPDEADCRFDTDCPVGFRCHARSGACLR